MKTNGLIWAYSCAALEKKRRGSMQEDRNEQDDVRCLISVTREKKPGEKKELENEKRKRTSYFQVRS
jgi:hypothetical protein